MLSLSMDNFGNHALKVMYFFLYWLYVALNLLYYNPMFKYFLSYGTWLHMTNMLDEQLYIDTIYFLVLG